MKNDLYLKTLFVLVFTMSIFQTAGAIPGGSEGTGGGNSVVCFDDPGIPSFLREKNSKILTKHLSHITSIQSYDLYLASLPKGVERLRPSISPIDEGETYLAYADRVLRRLQYNIPHLAQIAYDSHDSFKNNIRWREFGLATVNDVNDIGEIDSESCVVATLAIQYKLENQSYLEIDERLFFHPQHTELSRAVIYLHELFYRQGRLVGHADARKTMRLIASLIIDDRPTLKAIIELAMDFDLLSKEGFGSFIYRQETYPFRYALGEVAGFVGWTHIAHNIFQENFPDNLLWEAQKLVKSINSELKVESLGQAYGTLFQLQGNRGYSDSVYMQIKKMLVTLDKEIKERVSNVKKGLDLKMAEVLSTLDQSTYITEEYGQDIKIILYFLMDKFVKLANSRMTYQQIAEARKPNPSVLRFSSNANIFEIKDLNPYEQLNSVEDDLLRAKVVEWVKANILDGILFGSGRRNGEYPMDTYRLPTLENYRK